MNYLYLDFQQQQQFDLNFMENAVLCLIQSLSKNESPDPGFCVASKKIMAEKLGIGKRTLERHIKVLEDQNLIKKTGQKIRPNPGKFLTKNGDKKPEKIDSKSANLTHLPHSKCADLADFDNQNPPICRKKSANLSFVPYIYIYYNNITQKPVDYLKEIYPQKFTDLIELKYQNKIENYQMMLEHFNNKILGRETDVPATRLLYDLQNYASSWFYNNSVNAAKQKKQNNNPYNIDLDVMRAESLKFKSPE